MIFNKVPCIYFPSNVIMVDDNLSFLENTRIVLDSFENILLFDSPQSAINYLSTSNSITNWSILDSFDQDEIDIDNVVSIDYGKLNSFFHYEDMVSVLVVDYSMPEMNGDEFFERVIKNKQKKIMLTGEAESRIAIELFNNGLIDKFMTKNINEVNFNLNECISDLKKQFFLDLEINNFVSLLNGIKENPTYISAFNQWISFKNIIKFHQIDDHGSMVGLDQYGTNYYLYVLSESLLDSYICIAEENCCSELLLNQLKNGEIIPVFLDNTNKNIPVREWQKIVHEVKGSFEHNNNLHRYCYI